MFKQNEDIRNHSFGVRFWGLLTAVCFSFGLLCFILFSQASKSTDEKEKYIAQLEQDIRCSNELHAKAMAAASDELYDLGKRNDALYVLKDVMNASEDGMMPYSSEVRYALTQALGVYASDVSYVPLKNSVLEHAAVSMSLSEERTRFYLYDEAGNYLFMDSTTMSEIAVIDDVAQGAKPIWIGESLFYIDRDNDIAVCSEEGSKLLVEEGDYAYLSYAIDRNLYAYAYREVSVISPKDGRVLKRFVTPQLNSLMEVDDIYLTTERIFILAHSAAETQLLEYTPEGEFVGRRSLSDIEPGKHLADGALLYYLTPYQQINSQLVCYDMLKGEEVWRSTFVLPEIRTMFIHSENAQKSLFLANATTCLAFGESGECIFEENYNAEILMVEDKRGKDYVRVMLDDNTYRLISTVDWESTRHTFFDKQPENEATAVVLTAEYAFVCFEGQKELYCYGVSRNLQQQYKEDAPEGIVNRRGTLQMVCNDNGAEREYILYDFETGEERARLQGEYRSFAFVEDGAKYFLLYGSTLDVCSVEDASVVYSFENATSPLFSSEYDAVYLPKNENGVYNLVTGEKVGTMMNKADAKTLNLVLGNRGNTYALISENLDNVFLYRTKNGELIAQESISMLHAKDVFFSGDGRILCVLNDADVLELYDGTTLKKRNTLFELDNPGNKADMWYETAIQAYVLDTQGRDYILDTTLTPIADMKGMTAFYRKETSFLLEEMGYRYVPFLPYERLVEMGQHIILEYEPEDEIHMKYPL